MKNIYIGTVIILAIVMLTFPLLASKEHTPQGNNSVTTNTTPLDNNTNYETIKVYMSEANEVKIFNMEDYLFGVVAAEMPALYSDEALKAQAVAAYTYALYKTNQNALENYDITDNFQTDQAFITVDKAREKWGEDADTYENKIRNAVKSVKGKKLTYNGSPILSVYHAISSGKTESAFDIWGGSYDYLVSVDSVGDKLSPNYMTTAEFHLDDLKSKLSTLCEFSGDAKDYFGEIIRTESGSVRTVNICGNAVSGSSIRAALDLRSANFEVAFSEGKFIFTVIGYGHGIGMSQYGAHYMAMQGKTYEEILIHYYKGCEIK